MNTKLLPECGANAALCFKLPVNGKANQPENGDQVSRVAALAMKRGKSVDFTGYWQRYIEA